MFKRKGIPIPIPCPWNDVALFLDIFKSPKRTPWVQVLDNLHVSPTADENENSFPHTMCCFFNFLHDQMINFPPVHKSDCIIFHGKCFHHFSRWKVNVSLCHNFSSFCSDSAFWLGCSRCLYGPWLVHLIHVTCIRSHTASKESKAGRTSRFVNWKFSLLTLPPS